MLIAFLVWGNPFYSGLETDFPVEEQVKAGTPGEKKSTQQNTQLLPDAIPETVWALDGEREYYPEEELFAKINGAAERYKVYGNRRLVYASYIDPETPEEVVSVFVYEMETPLAALGIFSCERFRGAKNEPELGDAGYSVQGSIFFRRGTYYVQIKSFTERSGEACRKLAQFLDKRLEKEAAATVAFNFLPQEGRIEGSERFDPTDAVLGTGFLENIFSAEYGTEDKIMILFVVNCESAEKARTVCDKYAAFLEQQGEILAQEEIEGVNVEIIDLDGLYEGFFCQSGIFGGISEAPDQTTLKKYVGALLRSIKGGVVPHVEKKDAETPVPLTE